MELLRMYKNKYPGTLITFCGLDGCGKTTLINLLAKKLKKSGKKIIITKQPTDYVRNSDIFRTYMDSPNHENYEYRSLSLLAASDRVQHCAKIIVPELERGNIVISDRYFYSCLANLHARGFEDDKWIYEISESIIEPDAAFFIDVPVDTAIKRVRSREEEKDRYIDVDLQHKLRRAYMSISNINNGIFLSSKDTVDELCERVVENVNKIIARKEAENTKN